MRRQVRVCVCVRAMLVGVWVEDDGVCCECVDVREILRLESGNEVALAELEELKGLEERGKQGTNVGSLTLSFGAEISADHQGDLVGGERSESLTSS